MRLHFRHFPSNLNRLWPCKVILFTVTFLLLFQIFYLLDLLHTIITNRRQCLKVRKLETNLNTYPIFKQQNLFNLSKKPLNWINFSYKLQPTFKCEVNAVIVVHTKAENLERRMHLRRNVFDNLDQVRPFFVLLNNPTQWNEIENESKQFGDLLVVGGIIDSYKNITHKARAWITWLNTNCNKTNVILKMDDDVHLNLKALPALFKLFDNQKSLILCRAYEDGQVNRNPQSKWFLSRAEYELRSLGTYCQGMAYAFSGDLLSKMVKNMKSAPFLWMDDWYVTNALLHSTRATYIDIERHFVSTNDHEELLSIIQQNSTLRYEPMFGHFRPNNGLVKDIKHWNKILQLIC